MSHTFTDSTRNSRGRYRKVTNWSGQNNKDTTHDPWTAGQNSLFHAIKRARYCIGRASCGRVICNGCRGDTSEVLLIQGVSSFAKDNAVRSTRSVTYMALLLLKSTLKIPKPIRYGSGAVVRLMLKRQKKWGNKPAVFYLEQHNGMESAQSQHTRVAKTHVT